MPYITIAANDPKLLGSNFGIIWAYFPITLQRIVRQMSAKYLQNRLNRENRFQRQGSKTRIQYFLFCVLHFVFCVLYLLHDCVCWPVQLHKQYQETVLADCHCPSNAQTTQQLLVLVLNPSILIFKSTTKYHTCLICRFWLQEPSSEVHGPLSHIS